MIIERAVDATLELLEALRHLVPQLTDNNDPPDLKDLETLISSPNAFVVVARQPDVKGPIVGVGSLGIYRVPTGIRAVIEDVVVDEASRGQGVGEALLRELLTLARQSGARGVSLTSNARRLAANRLYGRMGFSRRQTNCYYYEFKQ